MKTCTRFAFCAGLLITAWFAGDRVDAYSYFNVGGIKVIWAGGQSVRYLSPSTFPINSDPDLHIRAAMGLWNIVPASNFVYSYIRLTQDFPIDNFDGFSDTAAVPASSLDPGVLGVTYLVNNGSQWFDMDMVFSDMPENAGYTFDPNPNCDIVSHPTPTNGFSFLLVAAHEMGHALGLGHDPIGNESPGTPWFIGTMNPRYPSGGPIGQENIIELHSDDRAGCRFLYPHSGPSEPPFVDLANAGYSSSTTLGKAVPAKFSPTTVAPAGVVTARSVIENFGTTNQFFVRQGFFISNNPTIEAGDTFLGELLWDIGFEDGFEFDVDIDMPADIAAGTYYLGSILDYQNEVTEAFEDNNAASYCTPLTVQRLSPVMNNLGSAIATCGQSFNGPTPSVTHPINMAPITWSLDNPEPGMTIHPTTGVISWPSPVSSFFPYRIFVRATNSSGSSTKDIFIGVQSAPPQIASIPNQSISPCSLSYTGPTPVITNPPCMNPIINWSLDTGPPGMTINFGTGVVSWTNPVSSATPYTVTIRATNAVGNGTRTFQLSVSALGDANGDGLLNFNDIPVFAQVLVGLDPAHISAADMNCDGLANGKDIQPFVNLLLGSP